MNIWPENFVCIVKNLLTCGDPIDYFQSNFTSAQFGNVCALLFDSPTETAIKDTNIHHRFGKAGIYNLGNYDRTAVLLPKNSNLVSIAHIANLDSNITSALPQYFKGACRDGDIVALLDYILENDINISALPYYMEDSMNTSGMRNQPKVYDCILHYALLRRLVSTHEKKDISLRSSDYLYADDFFWKMKNDRKVNRQNEQRAKSIYCFLLKTYIIEFSSNRSAENKLKELIDFVNGELGLYFESGMVLSYLFFRRSEPVITRFFQKVQRSSKNPLCDIEGMAWDLFNIWDAPTEMAISTSQLSCIALQSIATRDEAFADIAMFNPIQRMVMYKDEAFVKYRYALADIVNDSSLIDPLINNRQKRISVFGKCNLLELSSKLEEEFLCICKSHDKKR